MRYELCSHVKDGAMAAIYAYPNIGSAIREVVYVGCELCKVGLMAEAKKREKALGLAVK